MQLHRHSNAVSSYLLFYFTPPILEEDIFFFRLRTPKGIVSFFWAIVFICTMMAMKCASGVVMEMRWELVLEINRGQVYHQQIFLFLNPTQTIQILKVTCNILMWKYLPLKLSVCHTDSHLTFNLCPEKILALIKTTGILTIGRHLKFKCLCIDT